MPLKKDCHPDLIEQVDSLEQRCDDWAASCRLLKREWNLAAWYGLTAVAFALEKEIGPTDRGGSKHQTAATNLSRAAYQIYVAARSFGFKKLAGRSRMRCQLPENVLAEAVKQAFAYSLCCADFPAWHRQLYSLTSISSSSVSFESGSSLRTKQVLAYEKGYRPPRLRPRSEAPRGTVQQDMELASLIAEALKATRPIGQLGFSLPSLDALHIKLAFLFKDKLPELFRRAPGIELGGYIMEEFLSFHAALLAVAGAREYLCFEWSRMTGRLPLDDLIIHQTRKQWIASLAVISGLAAEKIDRIVSDLTFGNDLGSCDINIFPFMPLDDARQWLAIVPGIVVTSNAEECILRNRASRNKVLSDTASNLKEDEARAELQKDLPHLQITGPISLLKGMPDIDLVIEDKISNWVLIAELKWLQMPLSVFLREKRDEELRKGIQQIRFIRDFLHGNSRYLVSTKRMTKPLIEFTAVKYCVLCRDYIAEIGVSDPPLYSYTALKTVLEDGMSLDKAIEYMDSDKWLPSPPADFSSEPHRYVCNGVTISTEMLKPTYRNALNLIEETVVREQLAADG